MISFILALVILLLGFMTYGRLVEKVFGPDDRKTPATSINDGVDCMPIKTWKALLIQLLNIAGTGPISALKKVVKHVNICGVLVKWVDCSFCPKTQ